MRTVIIGTGATGGYFGAKLAKAGNDVTFLARGRHYEAIRDSGLVVKSARGDFKIEKPQVIDSISKIRDPELILFFVKTYDTIEIAKQLLEVVRSNTTIVTFQTGLENDLEIKKVLNSKNVYPGIIYINSKVSSPGNIEQVSGLCSLTFGQREKKDKNPNLSKVESLLKRSDIDTNLSNDIEYEIWKKLVWICAFSGVTVLYRSKIGSILNNKKAEESFKQLLMETFLIAKSKGFEIKQEDVDSIYAKFDYYRAEGKNAKTSLLLDIENGKRTEVETLQGQLVKYSKSLNLDTPLLELVYSIVRVHEKNITA